MFMQCREYKPTKPVQIYRNLNRRGRVYSIRQNGLVVAHTDKIALRNVEFRVQPAGLAKLRRTKKRNVHAYITGKITNLPWDCCTCNLSEVWYNPTKFDTFVDKFTHQPLHTAKYVNITPDMGIFAYLEKP